MISNRQDQKNETVFSFDFEVLEYGLLGIFGKNSGVAMTDSLGVAMTDSLLMP